MKKLPIYKLIINEKSPESGVDYVALVDQPAIEERGEWIMFGKQKQFKFKETNKEKRIISGFLMVADMPIYRMDEKNGEYYVVFEKETIEKIVKKFAKHGYHNNVNLMHNKGATASGVYMIESFIIDESRGKYTPDGFEKAPDGSWYASYYVENEELYQSFLKTGELKGFSVEGLFNYEYEEKAPKDYISQVLQAIDEL